MKYNNAFTIILLSFGLSACLPAAEEPKAIADKYWQNLQAGKLEEAKNLVSSSAGTNNEQTMLQHSNHIVNSSQILNENTKTIVSTTIVTTNPTTNQTHKQTFDTVLVLKDGQWKVDLDQTKTPPPPTNYEQELEQLSENLNQSMKQNMESIDESIQEGMQIFNEALRDGSKEMGESLLQMMNKLNESMKESIDKMKERRQQQLNNQQHNGQQKQPDPKSGEGII